MRNIFKRKVLFFLIGITIFMCLSNVTYAADNKNGEYYIVKVILTVLELYEDDKEFFEKNKDITDDFPLWKFDYINDINFFDLFMDDVNFFKEHLKETREFFWFLQEGLYENRY